MLEIREITLDGYDPNNIQPWLATVMICMTVMALFATFMRVSSRLINKQSLWWDDWLILFSMMWMLGTMSTFFVLYSLGVGLHIHQVPGMSLAKIEFMTKILLVSNFMYFWNLVFTKLSVLFMYFRIFRFAYFKMAVWVVGSFVVAWGVVITFLTFFICVPLAKSWDSAIPGKCLDKELVRLFNAISTILTDLIILLLPLPQVWKLQLRVAEKVGLTLIFGLGSFVIFTSTYRVSVVLLQDASDSTYTIAPTTGWTAIEISAGIVSACLPTMGPAIVAFCRMIGLKNGLGLNLWVNTGIAKSTTASGHHNSKRNSRVDQSTRASRVPTGATRQNNPAIPNTGNHRGTTSPGPFYRLPESNMSTDSDVEERSSEKKGDSVKLRPTHGFHRSFITTTTSNGHAEEVIDDIPLNVIHVRTDFVQSSSVQNVA